MDILLGPNQKPWHYHQAFGLRVRSCLPLPELPTTAESEVEVEINYGPVSSELTDAADAGLRYQTSPGRLLLLVDRIARFLILEGDKVLIDRHKNADDDDVRLFLLGPVFSGLLQQREDLVLRGSAIGVNGQGVAFLGPSGAGKSTLAMAFMKKGYRFLTDDLCVLRTGPEAPRMIQSGFPQANLWPDSLTKLGLPRETLKPVRKKLSKRAMPVAEGFSSEALPIKKVYLLNPMATEGVKLTAQKGQAAYTALENQLHPSPLLKGLGLEASYRQLALTLALTTPFTIVDRPKKKFLLMEMMDLLEADFLG